MTNQVEQSRNETGSITETMHQFVERLKLMAQMLERISYVKSTTNKLNVLIKDALSSQMILILGKERVGKTTLINALLGRNLLSAKTSHPTAVNTFVCYGEEECVKAYFLDGMTATFDIDKIDLFTISDTFIAQIIREHLDYIEIYIQNDVLKNVILIDTVALELGGDFSAYFNESLINRVDEVFWLLRSGSVATDSELALLEKFNDREVKPYFLVNAIDSFEGDIQAFIQSEKERYGQKIEDFLQISALQAIEAQKKNNTQLLIDSNYNEVITVINDITTKQEKRARKIMKRFVNWLQLLQIEIESIPEKEPFASAVEKLQNYNTDSTFEFTRQQRDLAIVSAYEEEYEKVSNVFGKVETLYQLLQVIDSEHYLQDETIQTFVLSSMNYHQVVREYRNLHLEYMSQYEAYEQQQEVQNGKSTDELQDELMKVNVEKLNTIQQQCVDVLEEVKEQEKEVISMLYSIQNHLTELAKKRLRGILMKVGELNVQRRRERKHLHSYANKLEEFKPLVEVQGFLRDAIKPAIVSGELPLDSNDMKAANEMIERILKVDLTEKGLMLKLSSVKNMEEQPIQTDFESKYPLYSLNLTEADIRSELPGVPEYIEG